MDCLRIRIRYGKFKITTFSQPHLAWIRASRGKDTVWQAWCTACGQPEHTAAKRKALLGRSNQKLGVQSLGQACCGGVGLAGPSAFVVSNTLEKRTVGCKMCWSSTWTAHQPPSQAVSLGRRTCFQLKSTTLHHSLSLRKENMQRSGKVVQALAKRFKLKLSVLQDQFPLPRGRNRKVETLNRFIRV